MTLLPPALGRRATLATGLALVPAALALAADEDPFAAYSSYIKISGQAAAITGNDAAYARRSQHSPDGAAGIEDLHLQRDLDRATTLTVDGRLLAGDADYLGKFNLTRNEVGTFEVGYKRFRTFYDGIGGFFPHNAYWSPLAEEELHTDRGHFWTDLKFTLPNAPVIHLRYSDERRTGQKDSTIWGDTDFTGIPLWNKTSLNPPYSSNRKLVPAYVDLDEHLRTLTAALTHTIGRTSFELGVTRAQTDNADTRWMARYPGELRPYPAYPTSASSPNILIPPSQANNATIGYDLQEVRTTTTTYQGSFETRLSETLALFGGVRYQHVSSTFDADRQMVVDVATATGTVHAVGAFSPGSGTAAPGRPPYSYEMGAGGATEDVLSGNLGVRFEPARQLFVTLALKGEHTSADAFSRIHYLNTKVVLATGATTSVPVDVANSSDVDETAWIPEVDVRYNGLRNVSLYANFDFRHVSGDEGSSYASLASSGTGAAGTWVASAPAVAEDNTGENHGHYKVGANWNVCTAFALRSELFYRDHRNSFTEVASGGDGVFLGYRYRGWKVSGILKPLPGLTCTTRYVQQVGSADVTVDQGASYDSMDSRNHLLGETIDWSPAKQVYLQLNLNVVFSSLSTAYPRAGGAANSVLRNADNDYWNGSFIAGCAVGPATDLELQASYYRATNYEPALIATIPYGADAKESSVAVALKHRFTPTLRATLKVGYFDRQNVTTGGFTNHRGPLAYLAVEHAL